MKAIISAFEAFPNDPADRQKTRFSSGTGFIVSEYGHIITNHHVIDGCTTVKIRFSDSPTEEVIVLHADEKNDLAILKSIRSLAVSSVAKFRFKEVKAGEAIAVYGFPLSGTLSSSGTIVSGSISSLAGINNDTSVFQISAPIQPGNSGGPLIDEYGSIVGIVQSKLKTGTLSQNVNFGRFLTVTILLHDSEDSIVDGLMFDYGDSRLVIEHYDSELVGSVG